MSDVLEVSSVSNEPVQVAVRRRVDGQLVDLTANACGLAFMSKGARPAEGDFHVGRWDVDGERQAVEVTVGPDTVALDRGRYTVWVQAVIDDVAWRRAVGALVVT